MIKLQKMGEKKSGNVDAYMFFIFILCAAVCLYFKFIPMFFKAMEQNNDWYGSR